MNALVINRVGRPVAENVTPAEDWPEPGAPGPGQVRCRTLASALNHMDLWVGGGVPGLELDYPRVSGCDACAEIEAVGPGVREDWVGTRIIVNAAIPADARPRPTDPPPPGIIPIEMLGEHHNGFHCAAFNVPVENVVSVGETDPVDAAAFGLTFLTAWSMMLTKGQLMPGSSVLITGIGGGVALAALSIAKARGCFVTVTSRHQWKLDKARELGADGTILDTGEDWSRDARALTNKRGYDMAVDSTGKVTHLNCIKSLAFAGAYVTPGCTTGPNATTDLARIFWNQLRILGSTMGTNDEFQQLAALLRAGKLSPVVDQVFSWRDGPAAIARLEAGEQFGKIVIDWR